MSIPKLKQAFDVEYKFFNNNNTIVCYVTPTKALDFLEVYTPLKKFKGTATFKEGDIFNIEEGKQIARKKAMRSYYKYTLNYNKIHLQKMQDYVNNRLAFLQQIEDRIEVLTNEIKDLTK